MLELREVRVSYGKDWNLSASCEFHSRTWTSILGHSGAGKSTLMQAIAGFVPLESGSIYLNNQVIDGRSASDRGFGYVFQNENLFDHLLVRDNLLLAMHDAPIGKTQRLKAVSELLSRLRIPPEYLDKYPTQLSGGERARVAVARAIARGQRWLILDEAFAGIDKDLRFGIQAWIESLVSGDFGLTVISLTHQIHDAHLFSDRIIALDAGRIVFDGPPSKLDARDGSVDAPQIDSASNNAKLIQIWRHQRASLSDRWSWLEDTRITTSMGFSFQTLILDRHEFSLDLPSGIDSTEWTPFTLEHPRIVEMGAGAILRDRGRKTILNVDTISPNLRRTVAAGRSVTIYVKNSLF